MSEYWVKIHTNNTCIEGVCEGGALNDLHTAFYKRTDEICDITLRESRSINSDRFGLKIVPSQITAIEHKYVG